MSKIIYRFKFSEEFLPTLVEFSTIHQHDKAKVFKEAFEVFTEDNVQEIGLERDKLEKAGYKGNIIEKMYKSARYYFKNKDRSEDNVSHKKRRIYIKQNKEFIDIIDRNLESISDLKPSEAFEEFKEQNKQCFEDECLRIGEYLNKEKTHDKIKKTFKNRYFLNRK
tara:strand:- start:1736 stop:2233 length:498 start_codon:yes stop_codon:yes gene_type:complete